MQQLNQGFGPVLQLRHQAADARIGITTKAPWRR
jgi:hypothetical protein